MSDNKKYRRLDDQFSIKDVGSTLLNHLAKGLYPADEVIREYVQNAIDAHRLWKKENHSDPESPIQIEVRGDRLSILDYGIGMFEDEVRRVKSIAVTTKMDTDLPLTGHKGVGIWAGLSYFERLILQTTGRGSLTGYRLTIHFKRIVDAINDRADIGEVMENNYSIDEFDEDYDEHYTIVTLEKATRSSDWFTEASKVRDAIRHICPCEIDPNFVLYDKVTEWYNQHGFETFEIVVEGIPVYRSFPSSVEQIKFMPITVNDIVVAQCWQVVNKKSQKLAAPNDELTGFRIIQNGFALGGDNLYGNPKLAGFKELNVSSSHYLAWYTGEIHIVSRSLKPNLQRNQLEESEEARQFIQRIRDFYSKIEEQGRTLSEKRKAEVKLAESIEATLKYYKEYSVKIGAIIDRYALLDLVKEDIITLTTIQSTLLKENQTIDSVVDSKKQPHLKDPNVRKQRKKLLETLENLLSKVKQLNSHSSHDKSKTLSSVDIYDSDNGQTNSSSEKAQDISLGEVKNVSISLNESAQTLLIDTALTSVVNDVDEGHVTKWKPIVEPSYFSMTHTSSQDEADIVSDAAFNGFNQENVFDSSSRKIPVSIVLGLLEILDDELGKGSDTKSVIITKLKEQINWVLVNV